MRCFAKPLIQDSRHTKQIPEFININKTGHRATAARPRAAAEAVNSAKTAKCPECRGGVSGHGGPSENPSSGQEPQLHPHHGEGEEGGVWGVYTYFVNELKREFVHMPRPCSPHLYRGSQWTMTLSWKTTRMWRKSWKPPRPGTNLCLPKWKLWRSRSPPSWRRANMMMS